MWEGFSLPIVLAAKVTLFWELSQPSVVVPIAEKVALLGFVDKGYDCFFHSSKCFKFNDTKITVLKLKTVT